LKILFLINLVCRLKRKYNMLENIVEDEITLTLLEKLPEN